MIYGIDIGGTKIEIAVFDSDLALRDRWRITTPQGDYDALLDAIIRLIAEADIRFGSEAAIGLGIPGLIDGQGRSLSANIPAANGHRVAVDIARRTGRTIVSENDCRCFAISEAVGGAGTGFDTVFGAILGTGAAGGLVSQGRLLRGRQGIAGEYGHLPLPAALAERYELPLRKCGCGLPACVESYVAGPGLTWLGRHHGADYRDVPSLAAAWRSGDTAALAARDCFLDILGATFANVTMMVDPDVIVLGGGLSLLDDLVPLIPTAITHHLFAGFPAPAVVPARFGDASGARGAAILAWQTTL